MAKLKKAQTGKKVATDSTSKPKPKPKPVVSDTTQYKDSTMTPAMKAYYEKLIRDKAKQAEEDRKAKPKGYKSGGKVVKKAAKAKYGAKKSAKKK